jgi:putative addiction module component (TIGR02574 family)
MNQAKLMVMTAKAKQILEAALELPVEEREHLVEDLSASLPAVEDSFALAAEIQRRSAEIEAGTAVVHDWPEARDKLLDELRGRR